MHGVNTDLTPDQRLDCMGLQGEESGEVTMTMNTMSLGWNLNIDTSS